jgi:hypothetical protein
MVPSIRRMKSAVNLKLLIWIRAAHIMFLFRWGKEFSLLRVVQTGPGAHPASFPMGTGSKAAGA